MDSETIVPSGQTVVRFTRSVYEIVEEFSDAIFASIIIIPVAFGLSDMMSVPNIRFFSLVVLWPWIRFISEVIYWRHETFDLLEGPNGKAFIIKSFGVFNIRSINQEIARLTITASQSWFERIIGVERVTLYDSSHQFVAGRRMPLKFRRKIERMLRGEAKADIPKPKFDPANGDSVANKLMMLQYAVSTGLINPDLARIKADELVQRGF
jgi:hypothetical protein